MVPVNAGVELCQGTRAAALAKHFKCTSDLASEMSEIGKSPPSGHCEHGAGYALSAKSWEVGWSVWLKLDVLLSLTSRYTGRCEL